MENLDHVDEKLMMHVGWSVTGKRRSLEEFGSLMPGFRRLLKVTHSMIQALLESVRTNLKSLVSRIGEALLQHDFG
jgi:hypothetical protein